VCPHAGDAAQGQSDLNIHHAVPTPTPTPHLPWDTAPNWCDFLGKTRELGPCYMILDLSRSLPAHQQLRVHDCLGKCDRRGRSVMASADPAWVVLGRGTGRLSLGVAARGQTSKSPSHMEKARPPSVGGTGSIGPSSVFRKEEDFILATSWQQNSNVHRAGVGWGCASQGPWDGLQR
jgi:hypothetical protein